MKIKEFIFGKYRYQYFLVREERKTLSLIVKPNLKLVVKVPQDSIQKQIDVFLQKKWLWLEKQLNYFKKYQKKLYQKEYISGESHLYLGRQYRLKVIRGREDKINKEKNLLIIKTSNLVGNGNYNKKILEKWYAAKVLKIFNQRYLTVQKNFNYDFIPKLIIRKMPKRWGSFLTKKNIVLNPDLIKASADCIDYVITHELCHMKYKNHSKQFYTFLNSKFPKWEKTKEKLELRMIDA